MKRAIEILGARNSPWRWIKIKMTSYSSPWSTRIPQRSHPTFAEQHCLVFPMHEVASSRQLSSLQLTVQRIAVLKTRSPFGFWRSWMLTLKLFLPFGAMSTQGKFHRSRNACVRMDRWISSRRGDVHLVPNSPPIHLFKQPVTLQRGRIFRGFILSLLIKYWVIQYSHKIFCPFITYFFQ